MNMNTLPPKPCCWVPELRPRTIAVVGDVQRTGTLELTLLGRRQNDREREAILRGIAADKPDMLLMLGDQVVLGDDDRAWPYFDRIMAPIHEADIPVMAMLGNHDYEGVDRSACIGNFCQRFPHQVDLMHGMRRLGDVAVVTLDSNFAWMTPEEIERQARDYAMWLKELDDDETIKGVIVASHHPPYTNSDLYKGRDLKMVEEMFARPFVAAKKTRLYLSGHVHAYERFITGDKMFIVSGGGGGPRREVSVARSRPYHNDAYRKPGFRPFHYILLTMHEDKITAVTKMLRAPRREEWSFDVDDRYSLKYEV